MPTPAEWVAVLTVGGGIGASILRAWQWVSGRDVRAATAEKVRAEAKQTAQATAKQEVDTLREIITEVRESEARKSQRIDDLERRLLKLEERERHMLTRAAVHEAWDQLAFNAIVRNDRSFPPPPPLAVEADPDGGSDARSV